MTPFLRLSYGELRGYAALARAELRDLQVEGMSAEQIRPDREVLNGFSLAERWSLEAYLLRESTVIIAGFNKRSTPKTGGYVNVYEVYTRLALRGQGQACEAYRSVMMLALMRGQRRLVTTAGSYGGWRTHRRLGLTAWGVNRRGQIVSDSPLHPDLDVPGRPPRATQDQPMTDSEQVQTLLDPGGAYRLRPEDLEGDWRALA